MNRRIAIVAFVFCLIVFSFGLVQLLKLRFQGGDVYPPYSSLRADPLGSMAFFEALERMPDISVRRDFSADNRLPEGKATTYLHLGAPSREWLKFFNTPLESDSVYMPSLVNFQPREMVFASREELIKDWVQAIDQWIGTANQRVAEAEAKRWETHERQQRGVEETKTRLTEADKYRSL